MPDFGSGTPAQHHLGTVGMAVDAPARIGFDRALQCMGRLEAELFGDLEHQGMPTTLCVWTLRRQRGWARQ